MYVGVILLSVMISTPLIGIPHVCGGDPELAYIPIEVAVYSPCMWG